MQGKGVLLIIGGGIAAYKALPLIRLLRESGVQVRPVLTKAGAEFVTPLSVSALAGAKLHTDLFDLNDEAEMGHIQLSRAADLVVVAPATADLLAKMAHGIANDLASTLLLATDKPVLVAPAMNLRMWLHPATQRNLAQLAADGIHRIGPNEGDMACGEFGPGRLAEPDEIFAAIAALLAGGPLNGRRILVTSGPTHEPIDPVRYIANRSSGAQGAAIASALAGLGAKVEFVTGPASVPPPLGVTVHRVETAAEMLAAVEAVAKTPLDAAICAAAVADWRIASPSASKIKKTADKDGNEGRALPALQFAENPDILKTISNWGKTRPALVVGFAAETDDVVRHASEKRLRKGCDWIVANDVRPQTGIMGGSENAVTLITAAGAESWPRASKHAVALQLAHRVAEALSRAKAGVKAGVKV